MKRVLQCIELAIWMRIAELAKRRHLTESKVRRDIENAIFLARSRMFEKPIQTDIAQSIPPDLACVEMV